jgi:hypothetical protein
MTSINSEDIELGTLGLKLPIGIWTPSGERLQEFTILRYIGKFDVILGELEDTYEEHPDKYHKIFSHFLPQVIAEVGGYSIVELAELLCDRNISRLLKSMYLADVIALLLNIRLLATGSDIPLSGKCPCIEEVEIQGGKNTAPHDLRSMVITVLPDGDRPPVYSIALEQPVNIDGVEVNAIALEPLRFGQMPQLKNDLPLDVNLIQLCSTPKVTREVYAQLSPDDIETLRNSVAEITFGAEKSIYMDCPVCAYQWDIPLEYGRGYEDFYMGLMQAPREGEEVGGTSLYYSRISKFLCFGDQAPCGSLLEVLNLTASERDFWITDLSETYEKQQREMEKSRK